MEQPTLEGLRSRNPVFFAMSQGTDHMQVVDREGEGYVLKVITSRKTKPVYTIREDLSLDFLRHD